MISKIRRGSKKVVNSIGSYTKISGVVFIITFSVIGSVILSKSHASPLTCSPVSTDQFKAPTDTPTSKVNQNVYFASHDLYLQNSRLKHPQKSTDKANTTSTIQQTAQHRKTAMVEAMWRNPTSAYQNVLTDSERADVTDLTSNCSETPASITGELSVEHYDFVKNDQDINDYVVTTSKKQRVHIHPANINDQVISQTSGTNVKVSGYLLDNDLVYDASSKNSLVTVNNRPSFLSPIASADVPTAMGSQSVVILMVYRPGTRPPDTPTKADVDDVVLNQANKYYLENSYGKTSITGTSYGWLQLATDPGCDLNSITDAAIKAADPTVNFANFGRILVVGNFQNTTAASSSTCNWSGMSTLGKVSSITADGTFQMSKSVVIDNYWNLENAGHELGHAIGQVMHANNLICSGNVTITASATAATGCNNVEYGDPYSVMGSFQPGHFTAPQKDLVGWFNLGNEQTITTSGTYVLEPYETNTTGLKVLKIQRESPNTSGYGTYDYVEYRQPIGFDNIFSLPIYTSQLTDVLNGALIHSDYNGSELLDATPPYTNQFVTSLQPGKSFTDPQNGTKITVISKSSTALTVNVLMGKTDFTSPTATVTAPLVNSTVSGQMQSTVDTSDSSGISKVEFYAFSRSATIPFATIATAPYTATFDTTKLANGTQYLGARVYDNSGDAWQAPGNITDLRYSVIVNNSDAVPPTVSITSPIAGSNVTSPVTVSANPVDNGSIYKTEFWKDNDTVPYSTVGSQSNTGGTSSVVSAKAATLTAGSHTVWAVATDNVGNVSTSEKVSFTVADPNADTTAPTWGSGANLVAKAVSDSQINLTWNNGIDNVGVKSYQISRNGSMIATIPAVAGTSGQSWGNTGLTSNTSYTYAVRAVDAAGNVSINSNTSTTTTQSPTPLKLGVLAGTISTSNPANPYSCPTEPQLVQVTTEPAVGSVKYLCTQRVKWFLNLIDGAGLTVNGFYNANTCAAVTVFKTRYGLPSECIFGTGAWQAMDTYGARTAPAAGAKVYFTTPNGNYHIVTADSQGKYNSGFIMVGQFLASFDLQQYNSQSFLIIINENLTTTKNVTLPHL